MILKDSYERENRNHKSNWVPVAAITILIALPLLNISYSKYKRTTEEAKTEKLLSLQDREADVLVDIIENLKLNLRTVAYHQAVVELEHAYPTEYREKFTAEQWETMLSEKTDEILEEAATVQLNPNLQLPPAGSKNAE